MSVPVADFNWEGESVILHLGRETDKTQPIVNWLT